MKKFLPYILILIILVGLFSSATQVRAQTALGTCTVPRTLSPTVYAHISEQTCHTQYDKDALPKGSTAQWTSDGTTGTEGAFTNSANPTSDKSPFQQHVDSKECGFGVFGGTLSGCFLQFTYYVFYQLAAFLLWLCAIFLNAMVAIGLSSKLFTQSHFIPTAWAVVRDISNVFFILVLLYIAVQLILGLGHDAKKAIVRVVIIALLINFSMFFTQVVIDTSNILALVFYNKLNVDGPDGTVRQYDASTQAGNERDIAGGMTQAFDPTSRLTPTFFAKAGEQCLTQPGSTTSLCQPGEPSVSMLIGITVIAGIIMLFAAYCFLWAGLSFLGRMIELWILIIFSAFAFMSSTVPLLENIEYIGWEPWLKRLLKVAFMAPIFMFFMYFIFLLIGAGIFANFIGKDQTTVQTLLLIVIPAGMILILLMKATEFAKKGSGKLGEVVMTAGKAVGMLALGAAGMALSAAATAGKTAVGGAGGALANKTAGWAEKKGFGRTANKLRDLGQFAQKSSFDVRGVKIGGKSLSSVTGLNLGEVKKGGWTEMKKQQVENRQKRADELVKRGTSGQRKKVEEAEAKLNEAELPVKLDLEQADKVMDKFRKELNDAQKSGDVAGIAAAKSGLDTTKRTKAGIRSRAGLDSLERDVRDTQRDLNIATGRIAGDYARQISSSGSKILNSVFRLGAYSVAGADEAARRIRKGAKVVEEKH